MMRLLLVMFVGLSYYFSYDVSDNVLVNDCLEASWLEYDFGKVTVGEHKTCDLFIKNISDKNIKITHILPTCHCLNVEYDCKIIEPKKIMKIHIDYDSSNRQAGYIEQGIILCIENHRNPIYFVFKAELS